MSRRLIGGLCLMAMVACLHAGEKELCLFNGKDLNGWEGGGAWWRVEDGVLTCERTPTQTAGLAKCLMWTGGTPDDFILECDFKLSAHANAGLQFRSERRPDHGLHGYQAGMTGDGRLVGFIHHNQRGLIAERGQQVVINRKGELLATCGGKRHSKPFPSAAELLTHYKPGEWNHYRVICRGSFISVLLNGVPMSLLEDFDPATAAAKGYIGLQMHDGPPMKVQFKNIILKCLPGYMGEHFPTQEPSTP